MKLIIVSNQENLEAITSVLESDKFKVVKTRCKDCQCLELNVYEYQYKLALIKDSQYYKIDNYKIDDINKYDCLNYDEKKIYNNAVVYLINN